MVRPTDRARRILLWAEASLAVVAVLVAGGTGLLAAGNVQASSLPGAAPWSAALVGLVVAASVLLICLMMLVVVGWVWRRRIDFAERTGWAVEWAQVEPRWSRRDRRRPDQ